LNLASLQPAGCGGIRALQLRLEWLLMVKIESHGSEDLASVGPQSLLFMLHTFTLRLLRTARLN